jgi:predicted GNAT family N-acyltransferase
VTPRVHIRLVTSDEDLSACIAIRRTVFIEGQGVPEPDEFDGLDPECTHLIAETASGPVGTVRLRISPEGLAKLERLAVLEEHRGAGIGGLLTRALEREARRLGHAQVVLGAQVRAIAFYEGLGYAAEGPVYDDAGIPHRLMRREI